MHTTIKLGDGVSRFLGLPPVASSVLPFQMADYVANQCLTSFNDQIARVMNVSDLSVKKVETSCVISMYALGVIFSGQEKMEKIFARLRHSIDIPIMVNSDNGEIVEVKIKNLFTGIILRSLESQFEDKENWNQNESVLSLGAAEDFISKVIPEHQESHSITKCFSSVNYDFNAATIEQLAYDFERNRTNVNTSSSYVYYISMLRPVQVEGHQAYSHFHAFLIVQLYDEKKKTTNYRVYQSWIDKMTLKDYIDEKKYDQDSIGSYSHEQIMDYVKDLKKFCQPEFTSEAAKAGLRCFGPSLDYRAKVNHFDATKLTISGLSVRYVMDKTDPRLSSHNFMQFLNQKKLTT